MGKDFIVPIVPIVHTTTEAAPTGCKLDRQLDACALRRAGCGSLYDVLLYLYPPHGLLDELRNRQNAPEVATWLRRLEVIGRW